MKKFLLFLFSIVMVFLLSASAFAENFYITDYKVGIMVADNGEAEVKEVIEAYFTTPSHGIIRTIPVSYNLKYQDGTSTVAQANISNVSVNEKVKTYREGNDFVIRIGNPDKLVSGKQEYVIKYKFKASAKTDKEDEFYYNIIGTEWGVPIEKVTFKVTMPKEFDKSKAGLSIGRQGTAGFNGGAGLYSDGKSVWSYIERQLLPGEGVTVRIPLGENYYSKSLFGITPRDTVLLLIIAFTGLAFFIWLIFGKDDPIIPVINFYPPEDKNSAEVGAIYHEGADIEDIVSLIIYLASKGYIKIENPGGNFKLRKMKEYTSNQFLEKDLMVALFHKKDSVSKQELAKDEGFYYSCKDMVEQLKEETKLSFFDEKACSPGKVTIMVGCITAITALMLYSSTYYSFSAIKEMLFTSVLPWLYVFLTALISISTIVLVTARHLYIKLFTLLLTTALSAITIHLIYCNPDEAYAEIDTTIMITGIIGLIISLICAVNLPKRNKTGQKELGMIAGFKKFIETADKAQIEKLAKENPGYCFDVLPYAYVLGVASTWINKIEHILKVRPDWYDGHLSSTSFITFSQCLKPVVPQTHSSSSFSSSHSSHGGGGFSGGGHGGGGGHSW